VKILDDSPQVGSFGRFFKRSPVIWEALGDDLFSALLDSSSQAEQDVLISDESIGVSLARESAYAGKTSIREPLQDSNCLPCIPHLTELTRVAKRWGFSDVQIACVIRRQDTWLASAYAQESDRRPDASQEDFKSHVRALLDPQRRRYSDGVVLNYYAVHTGFTEVLGSKSVMTIPYEQMRIDILGHISEWCKFLDLSSEDAYSLQAEVQGSSLQPQNVRSISECEWDLRPPNSVHASNGKSTCEARGSIKIDKKISIEIIKKYKNKNKNLDKKLGVGLKKYKYF